MVKCRQQKEWAEEPQIEHGKIEKSGSRSRRMAIKNSGIRLSIKGNFKERKVLGDREQQENGVGSRGRGGRKM